VKKTGKEYRLQPMAPAVRRFAHKYLAQKPGIKTSSEGEGKWRKVVVYPKK
jgi:predicted RNA-binding protein Jag